MQVRQLGMMVEQLRQLTVVGSSRVGDGQVQVLLESMTKPLEASQDVQLAMDVQVLQTGIHAEQVGDVK